MLNVDVLIIGGGGCGLTSSMLLSQLGVDSLLVSALPTTSILPKAHVLNQRAMEILGDVGIAEEIYEVGTPPEFMKASAWYAGFAGPREGAGRRIGKIEAWGAGGDNTDWSNASPRRSSNLPQIRLEPIMRRRAEELAPGRVRFHHEVIEIEQSPDCVIATIVDRDKNESYQVRAQYLLGCDGGRTVGRALGVEMVGLTGIFSAVSIHMAADLSNWAQDRDVLLRWIWLASGQFAVLAPMGPDHWGPESEEWVFHLNYPESDPKLMDDVALERDMREALGLGNYPLEIKKISRWSLEGVLATRFQVGRVLLLGDAAHRHPPTGGLGLTSAIHDAHNACWKLAMVLKHGAGPQLLETYEVERRAVDSTNVQRSVESAMNHLAMMANLGITVQNSPDQNWAAISRLWSTDPADRDFQRLATRTFASQSMEFTELNVEYGYRHDSSAVLDDGTPQPKPLDSIRIYKPSTRPGSPLPHAWLDTYEGDRISTLDLVKPARFLLIAGENGQPWCDAAVKIAADLGLPIDTARIGHLDGDYLDPRCQWLQRRDVSAEGAILVRPDRCIAARKPEASSDPYAELLGVFKQILGIQ